MSTKQKKEVERIIGELRKTQSEVTVLDWLLFNERRKSSRLEDELDTRDAEARTWAHLFRVLAYHLRLRESPWK